MSLFQQELIDLVPTLRAYALLLTAGRAEADDLVQDTVEKAWRARDHFEPQSNMKAWLFTILRNSHYTTWRKNRRTVEDVDDLHARRLTSEPAQGWSAEYANVLAAIDNLDAESRHALLLITAGLTYEEAAMVCECPLRTLQSRVRRARQRLATRLDGAYTV